MQGQPPESGLGVNVGDVLAGKYRVERVLGTGGMGVVVAALHLELGERVAVKFLYPHALRSKDAVARFAREARAAVRIKGEHVARTVDVGKLETGAPYLVMEYLEGADLASRLQTHGPLAVTQAVEFILHACEALAEAHGLGIVHRDLKPANLFVTVRPDGTESVKILDFGISKMMADPESSVAVHMTATHTIMGSPLYLSPEQTVSARNADIRSDIWALGTTLYEILTGSPPFEAGSLPDLYHQIRIAETPALRNLRPDAPAALQNTIYRCLQKRPEDRFQHVAELAVALAEFAPAHAHPTIERIVRLAKKAPTGAMPAVSAHFDPGPASMVGSTVGSWGQTQEPARGGRLGIALLAVTALAILGAGAAWYLTQRNQLSSTAGPPPPTSGAPAEVGLFEVKPDDAVPAPASASASAAARPDQPNIASARATPPALVRPPTPTATAAPPAPLAPQPQPQPTAAPASTTPPPPPPTKPDPGSLFRDRH